ncbi:helix-turn-helix transcriptional regulator [Streptomyces sp. V3I8]|uniref:helix-turn-helix domain-containing protein n=1 Tax=Streptomyces sp. V3I8 TaxID=3042279 RepID=UPI0027D805B2|nr:helix-turn-helix transcriptional regulator [Streptomyces sp. V3I8]
MAGDEFTDLLGRLKERSGLSYGVLAKRLHTSASTLHRYVNGDAVPTDYAPVERFARLCRATPEELVELHRRWILADASRGQKPAVPGTPAASAASGAQGADPADGPGPSAPVGSPAPPAAAGGAAVRRRRTGVLAGAAVAAAVVAALVVNLVPDGGDEGRGRSVGAAGSAGGRPETGASGDAKGRSASPSASPSGKPSASASPAPSPSVSRSGAARGPGPDAASDGGATAPTVAVDAYSWEDQCSQHYLVDRGPGQVPPPPSEPDARGWVNALGGVAAGQQMLTLTVQGAGRATVVLEELHVRVVARGAPLAWNDFAMGVGCGGGVRTASFGVDLDDGRPATSPRAGQRDFPYKVSETDPEVFHVFADARTHHVSWYLELEWSSGSRKGTLRVDDHGRPFRTSGHVGRPAYTYPLGDSAWGRDEYRPDVPG